MNYGPQNRVLNVKFVDGFNMPPGTEIKTEARNLEECADLISRHFQHDVSSFDVEDWVTMEVKSYTFKRRMSMEELWNA